MYLTREQILKSTFKTADVDAFGGTIRIRELTAREREAYEQFVGDIGKKHLKNIRSKLLAYCIIDEDNNQLFSEKDVQELDNLSSSDVDSVWKAIQVLSGIASEDDGELEKN